MDVGAGNKVGPVGGIVDVCFRQPGGLWGGGLRILECLPGFQEAKSLGLIHIHFRLKVKDSQPLLISLSLAELCVQGSLAL